MARRSSADVHATPADRAACREAIRQGSRSFHLAGRLLPVEVREPAYAVYAFCRMADDLVDEGGAGIAAVDEIRRCLDRVYAGRPNPGHVERALTDAVNDHGIPRLLPEALVEGLSWDAEGRSYETLSDLRAYAVRVAGVVGIMMSLVMGRRDPDVLARAADLGIAMQFSNICRDVGDDARLGRVYLPADMLGRAGLSRADVLAAERITPALRAVVEQLLAEAETHYDLAAAGVAELPAGARIGINAARLLYREIGRKVGAGIDPVTTRAVVPGRRKLSLLARALSLPAPDPLVMAMPCAPEALALVEAAARLTVVASTPRPAWWDFHGRAVRLVELLADFGSAPATGRRLR